jgi:hypothetical protein
MLDSAIQAVADQEYEAIDRVKGCRLDKHCGQGHVRYGHIGTHNFSQPRAHEEETTSDEHCQDDGHRNRNRKIGNRKGYADLSPDSIARLAESCDQDSRYDYVES